MLGQAFRGLPKPNFPTDTPYYGDSIDIDNNGTKETVFYTKVAMNKVPHYGYIVKDDIIIFESSKGANVQIYDLEKPEENGFYVSERYFDISQGDTWGQEWKYTEYSYSNDLIKKISEEIRKDKNGTATPPTNMPQVSSEKEISYLLKNNTVSKIVNTNNLNLYNSQSADITGDGKNDTIATFTEIGCADCVKQRILILSNNNILFDITRDFPTLLLKPGQNAFTVKSSIYLSSDYTCCASKRQVESYEYKEKLDSFGLKDIEITPTYKATP